MLTDSLPDYGGRRIPILWIMSFVVGFFLFFLVCLHELNSLWQAMARHWLARTTFRTLRPPMQINNGIVEATLKLDMIQYASDRLLFFIRVYSSPQDSKSHTINNTYSDSTDRDHYQYQRYHRSSLEAPSGVSALWQPIPGAGR
jgi:hypothetical protein